MVKTPQEQGFVKPIISQSKVDKQLLTTMITGGAKPLLAWKQLFEQIDICHEDMNVDNTTVNQDPVSFEDLESLAKEEDEAMEFKTPRRGTKRSSPPKSISTPVSFYKRRCVGGARHFEGKQPEEMKDLIIELFVQMDSGLANLQDQFFDLQKLLNTQQNYSEKASRSLEGKIKVLQREIGRKSPELLGLLDDHSIWGTIESLLGENDTSSGESPGISSSDLVESMNNMREALELLRNRMSGYEKSRVVDNPMRSGPFGAEEATAVLETMLAIQNRVAELELKNKPKTVKFGGVNLESLGDAKAWLEQHLAPDLGNVALIVDVHTVMEHALLIIARGEFPAQIH